MMYHLKFLTPCDKPLTLASSTKKMTAMYRKTKVRDVSQVKVLDLTSDIEINVDASIHGGGNDNDDGKHLR